MDGRNSVGRRISLLNDDVPIVYRSKSSSNSAVSSSSKSSPSFSSASSSSSSRSLSFAHSRASSSGASSPCHSPHTPPLIRSSSSDSTDMDVPSPITPEFAGESFESLPGMSPRSVTQLYSQNHSAYFVQTPPKDVISTYPPISSHSVPLPYPHHVQQLSSTLSYPPASFDQVPAKSHGATAILTRRPQQPRKQQQQQPQPEVDSRSAPQNARTKKGQHPCPLAKQFNCPDTFTTSGHASRHAKKHTGEKSAVCPDCGKDFTRKDNMEQHRKTHLSGRNSNKGRSSDASKASRTQTKRPKPGPLQATIPEAPISASPVSLMQQQLPDFVAPSQDHAPPMHLYPDPTSCAVYPSGPFDGGSPSALHTLASAASIEGRGYLSGGY